MGWRRVLAYITGTADEELLLRNEQLALPKGAPTLLYHQECKARLIPELRCSCSSGLLVRDACHFDSVKPGSEPSFPR